MIVVTGAAGFIGSNLVRRLNQSGYNDVIIVDNIGESEKWHNLEGCSFVDYLNYTIGIRNLSDKIDSIPIDAVFHIGANSNVLVRDADRMIDDNFNHSKMWLDSAKKRGIPFLYASSSAVYGNSPDFRAGSSTERPHNVYALSKLMFDNYVDWNYRNECFKSPVLGFRIFNVFGFGEEHKEANASLPRRFAGFLKEEGKIPLFRDDITRDYASVTSVCDIFFNAWITSQSSGIYNLGSGNPIKHRQVAEMAVETARNLRLTIQGDGIEVIDMTPELRNSFQFKTCAENVPSWISKYTKTMRNDMAEYLRALME